MSDFVFVVEDISSDAIMHLFARLYCRLIMTHLLKALPLFSLLFYPLRVVLVLTLLIASQPILAISFSEMVDLAISNNEKYQQSQTQVRANEFARDSADALSLPQISLGGNHQYIDSSMQKELYDSSQASVTLRQSLWNEAISSSSKLTNLQINLAQVQQEQQLQLLLKELSDLYFDYTHSNDRLELISSETSTLESLLEAEEERFKANATSSVNLSQVRADYYQSRAEEISQKSNLELATDLLIAAIGKKVVPPEPKNSDKLDLLMPEGDEESWLNRSIVNNFNIRKSQISIQLAEEKIEEAKGGYSPNVSVFGSYTWKRNNIGENEKSFDDKAIGIELSWLLYGGGSTSSKVNQYQENYRSSQLELDYQQKAATNLVRHYWRVLLATQSELEANAMSVQSAYQAYQASQISFDSGVLKYTDLLARQNSYFNAALRLQATRYSYMRNYINLYYNSGLLDHETFINIVSAWVAP